MQQGTWYVIYARDMALFLITERLKKGQEAILWSKLHIAQEINKETLKHKLLVRSHTLRHFRTALRNI